MIAKTNVYIAELDIIPIIIRGRDQQTGAALDKVYKPKKEKVKNKKDLSRKIKWVLL